MILSVPYVTEIVFTHHALFWADTANMSYMFTILFQKNDLPRDKPMPLQTMDDEIDMELLW